jgi:hypothetical protein
MVDDRRRRYMLMSLRLVLFNEFWGRVEVEELGRKKSVSSLLAMGMYFLFDFEKLNILFCVEKTVDTRASGMDFWTLKGKFARIV